MKGDKLEDRIAAAKEIIKRGTCAGYGIWCPDWTPPLGNLPCPNRGRIGKPLKGWSCVEEDKVASAKAWLKKHAPAEAAK